MSSLNTVCSSNLRLRWDCDLNNESSKHLAKKLGFHTPKTYTIFAKK
ncbi:GNAT family N-acetyltransferase [Priestia filamentosa]|nr:GNAT family N-acetyltransferase [Priestia filamentosa]OXS65374.1 hypothetical protein B1B01_22780 [Priestia filamentosa]RJS65758.1 GNAT family N-acetyltransferase [Priestia filamentosa]